MKQENFQFRSQEKKENAKIFSEKERMTGEYFFRIDLTTEEGGFVLPYICKADSLGEALEKAGKDPSNASFKIGNGEKIDEKKFERLTPTPDPRLKDD